MSEEEKEEIYEMTAQILGLGFNLEDAKERFDNQVCLNETLEEVRLTDWSHLDDPTRTIKDLTWKIKRRERHRRY